AWAIHLVCLLNERRLAGKAVSEHFITARGFCAVHRLKHHVVATGRQRSAVPRSLKGDERAGLILLRELGARVEHQVARRPVARKPRDRQRILAAIADLLAVAPVLWHQQALALLPVVIAIRPAEVGAILYALELFRWQVGVLLVAEVLGKERVELVASVLNPIERTVVPGERVLVARARGVTATTALLRLPCLVLVESPHAAMLLEQRARLLAGGTFLPILL